MKVRIFVLSVSFLTGVSATCQEPFDAAKTYYHQGDYQQAFVNFMQIERKSPEVVYNMGNCAYQQKNFLLAYRCWQWAAVHASKALYDDCLYNCSLVLDKISADDNVFWLDRLLAKCNMLVIQLLFLFFWYVFLWFTLRRCSFKPLIMVLLLSVLALNGILLQAKYRQAARSVGLVQEKVTALAGPDMIYQQVASFKKDELIEILEQSNEWIKVVGNEGKGWIRKEIVLFL